MPIQANKYIVKAKRIHMPWAYGTLWSQHVSNLFFMHLWMPWGLRIIFCISFASNIAIRAYLFRIDRLRAQRCNLICDSLLCHFCFNENAGGWVMYIALFFMYYMYSMCTFMHSSFGLDLSNIMFTRILQCIIPRHDQQYIKCKQISRN